MTEVERIRPIVSLMLSEEEAKALVEALAQVSGCKDLFSLALSAHEDAIAMRVRVAELKRREQRRPPVTISCSHCNQKTSDAGARVIMEMTSQCSMCRMLSHADQHDAAGVNQGET